MIDKVRKAEIARENGRKSNGATTPEGKRKTSRNALKHGKSAKKFRRFVPCSTTILSNEDRNEFGRIYQSYCDQLDPHTEAELDFVHRIADAQWRLNRWEFIESHLFEAEFESFPESFAERFKFLRGAAELLAAARNMQAQKPDAQLFPQIRYQQTFYVRLYKHHMDEYCRLRREFPSKSRRLQSPAPELFAPENEPSSDQELGKKRPRTAQGSSNSAPPADQPNFIEE